MDPVRLLLLPVSLAIIGRPGAAQTKPGQTVVTPVGEVRVLSPTEATKLVNRIKSKVLSRKARRGTKKKGAPPSFLARLDELEALTKVQHKSLVGVIEKVMLTDKDSNVRRKAAKALMAQPRQEATRVAIALLKDRKLRRQGTVAGSMIELISYHGAPKGVWKELRRRFLDMGSLGQQALLRHAGERKDWDFVELIIENIDAPAPVNVDDPNNPPASYWKARWEQWRAIQPPLKEACEKLFGRKFSTRKDAEIWIAEQGGLKKLRKKAKG